VRRAGTVQLGPPRDRVFVWHPCAATAPGPHLVTLETPFDGPGRAHYPAGFRGGDNFCD